MNEIDDCVVAVFSQD